VPSTDEALFHTPGGRASSTGPPLEDVSPAESQPRKERLLQSDVDEDRLYAAVVQSVSDAIITKTLDGRITAWNRAAERIFGFTAEEAIGQPIGIIVPTECSNESDDLLERSAKGEFVDHYETVRRTKDGRLVDVSLSVTPIRARSGESIGAAKIVRDITERKFIEREFELAVEARPSGILMIDASLRHKRAEAQHRQFERLVTAMPDAVIVADRAAVIRFANDAALELFGKHHADLVGEPLGFAVREGLVADIVIPRGKELRNCEVRVAAGCEWNGMPAFLVLVRDVTEQKRLNEQLQHARKMEAVGLMAGGVAHDFNNLLLVMLVYAEMLREDYGKDESRLPAIVEIVHSIERAQGLTRQLLAFSRRQPSEASVLNMGEMVTGIHPMLRRMLSANIEMVTVASEELWPVLVDKGQIEQVLMNLAVNARDAMPSGGRFAVEIANRSIAVADLKVPPGDYVAMRISDTGMGIEPEHLGRIFDPFFTTKERGGGIGLGLSTCYGIVTQAGGSLTVDSKIGAGATFTVLLPRTFEEACHPLAAVVMSEGVRGRETILIVEDDHAVMRATAETLKKGGYTILTAGNGDEACRLIQRQSGGIDLVLSDVMMPQLGGPKLAEFLATARPDTPIVFMTGYSDYPIVSEHGDNSIAKRRAIMKPFRPSELLSIVREVLDGGAQPSAARA
jgi:two-component system, cell cycle sensor histidine kinase and response regulator CckA